MHRPRLLFLDAYDSFSNNIISLLQDQLNASVEVIHIDDKRFATSDAIFYEYLRRFDGVVAGPGPGDPRNPQDLGLIARLWDVSEGLCLPILGVCLGFQSLALAFGAFVEKLREPRHGLITPLVHQQRSLFQGAGLVKATQYHSLHVRLDRTGSDFSWEPTPGCPSLEPLAWDLSDSARNGPVLMAVKHQTKPFWGVQYHPESICTNEAGATIIRNWWTEALEWSLNRAAAQNLSPEPSISASYTFDLDPSDSSSPCSGGASTRSSLDYNETISTGLSLPTAESTPAATRDSSRSRAAHSSKSVSWRSIDLPQYAVPVTALLQKLQGTNDNIVMLESGTKDGRPVRSETGRFSIIACLDQSPRSIRYSTRTHKMNSNLSGSQQCLSATMEDVWSNIETFMTTNRATGGPADVPFWGGLTGFVTYEAGLETININPPAVKETHPDVWLLFVERSVVIDHVQNKLYIQSLHDNDEQWMKTTEEVINGAFRQEAEGLNIGKSSCEEAINSKEQGEGVSSVKSRSRSVSLDLAQKKEVKVICEKAMRQKPAITAPLEAEYSYKVRLCQDHIRAGDSYELCLTDQSTVSYPSEVQPSSWELYARLRETNPAPFGVFLNFKEQQGGENVPSSSGVTMLSSSPERFLSWSREGKCQFRPIKGTVQKSNEMTREKAEEILKSQKEQAENLMIVDLIRHDLHGVVGSGNVKVEKLMQVEEYETVFQLVSVIEGQLPYLSEKKGMDVLAASLPPGSMTGAPKKRSCELLKDIEGGARGIYSGVLGYFDVGGGGDFSVIIRTGFRWSDEIHWSLGAGGAVTSLSTADGEFEEMMAKRSSSLRAFS